MPENSSHPTGKRGGKRSTSWGKGQSGNPHGRPKGVPNKVTSEARAAANALVDDPAYRQKLADDLRERKVAPAIEAMLWYYAKGKPPEHVEHTGVDGGPIAHDLSSVPDDSLRKIRALLLR